MAQCPVEENPDSTEGKRTSRKRSKSRFSTVFAPFSTVFPDRLDSRIARKIRHRAVFRRAGAVKKR
jgi:hypothetical protein